MSYLALDGTADHAAEVLLLSHAYGDDHACYHRLCYGPLHIAYNFETGGHDSLFWRGVLDAFRWFDS